MHLPKECFLSVIMTVKLFSSLTVFVEAARLGALFQEDRAFCSIEWGTTLLYFQEQKVFLTSRSGSSSGLGSLDGISDHLRGFSLGTAGSWPRFPYVWHEEVEVSFNFVSSCFVVAFSRVECKNIVSFISSLCSPLSPSSLPFSSLSTSLLWFCFLHQKICRVMYTVKT